MITALTDPTQLPNQLDDQETFDTKMANFLDNLPERARQENDLAANMSMYAAGGAYAFPYIFDSSTVDGDPGVGKLRLGSTTQNAATVMRMDVQIVGAVDISNVLADLRAATSAVKGSIRLVKMTDPSKWMIFDVTAVALPSGYRNLTVSARAASGTNPFANGDALMVYIDRNGDSGTVPGATELMATIPVPNGVAAVSALNVFDADHDWYFIHFSGIGTSAPVRLVVQLAVAGVLATSQFDYAKTEAGVAPLAANSRSPQFIVDSGQSTTFNVHSGVLQIGDVNSAAITPIIYDGVSKATAGGGSAVAPRGFLDRASAVSGFGISIWASAGTTFTGGTIRVYGVRKA